MRTVPFLSLLAAVLLIALVMPDPPPRTSPVDPLMNDNFPSLALDHGAPVRGSIHPFLVLRE